MLQYDDGLSRPAYSSTGKIAIPMCRFRYERCYNPSVRLWGSLKRISFSLLVVLVIAATTAGGLTGTWSDIGQSFVSVTGRSVVEPGPARVVVETDGDEVDALTSAPVAQAVVIPVTSSEAPPLTVGTDDGPIRSQPDVDQEPETIVLGTTLTTPTVNEPDSTTTTTTQAPTTTASTTTAAPSTTAAETPLTTKSPATKAPTTTAAPVDNGPVKVSNSGHANGGGFSNTPIEAALAQAKPGTVFAFEPGQHKALKVSSVNGAQGNPIVLTAADKNNRPVFTDGGYTARAGIEVTGSSNVAIAYLDVRKSMWGIRVEGSSGIVIDAARVSDIGQEGIRVTQRSSWVTIRNSVISGTGRRSGTASDGQSYSLFGEGIYIGSGQDSSDEVHHIVISGNDISQTGTEAIDVKAPAHDVEITKNVIHDIQTGTSGAIVVHLKDDYVATNPNIRVTYNKISNISTNSGHRDGVGVVIGSSVDVIGNTIRNTAHYGIRIEDKGSQGGKITVNIVDNTFASNGQGAIWQSGNKAKVNTSGNTGA